MEEMIKLKQKRRKKKFIMKINETVFKPSAKIIISKICNQKASYERFH